MELGGQKERLGQQVRSDRLDHRDRKDSPDLRGRRELQELLDHRDRRVILVIPGQQVRGDPGVIPELQDQLDRREYQIMKGGRHYPFLLSL